jgi:hypothetical protein
VRSVSDASRLPSSPVIDLVDDGKTDDEIAALTDEWRLVLRDLPTVDIGATAAEVLDELYADGDL